MAKMQRYGIKYPFSNDNLDNIYMDTNDTYTDNIKSQVLHVIFTPKGMKLRDPDFGTNLVNYIFGPKDGDTLNDVKSEISSQVGKYVPAAKFKDINVYNDETDENAIVVTVSYSVKIGNKTEDTTVAIKL
jgi:phage baseplate assembly protein W